MADPTNDPYLADGGITDYAAAYRPRGSDEGLLVAGGPPRGAPEPAEWAWRRYQPGVVPYAAAPGLAGPAASECGPGGCPGSCPYGCQRALGGCGGCGGGGCAQRQYPGCAGRAQACGRLRCDTPWGAPGGGGPSWGGARGGRRKGKKGARPVRPDGSGMADGSGMTGTAGGSRGASGFASMLQNTPDWMILLVILLALVCAYFAARAGAASAIGQADLAYRGVAVLPA